MYQLCPGKFQTEKEVTILSLLLDSNNKSLKDFLRGNKNK